MELSLHLYGAHGAEFYLKGAAWRGGNLKPALERVGYKMLDTERKIWRTRGAYGGHPWAPSIETGRPVDLYNTGALFSSLTERGATGNIFNVTRSSVYIGTTIPYFKFHQKGWDTHMGMEGISQHVPARPPIQVTEHDENRYARILLDWIVNGELHA